MEVHPQWIEFETRIGALLLLHTLPKKVPRRITSSSSCSDSASRQHVTPSSSQDSLSAGHWLTGNGAARWCDNNNVDAGAKQVFLSLSLEEQDQIRKMGTVWNTYNPSKVLMGRIRQVAGPGFVPETTSRECFVGPQEARPQIVVCV